MVLNPKLMLGGAFRAPPVASVSGLGGRGPVATASATGGVDTSNLVGSMQDEIAGTTGIADLIPKLLGTGVFMREQQDAQQQDTQQPAPGYEAGGALSDDGTFHDIAEQVMFPPEERGTGPLGGRGGAAPAPVTPSVTPLIPDNITVDQAKDIARETMGLTGKEGEEDAYTALMMFGLGLMATPGDLGEAIGKAGLNIMPQIIAARKAQRGRRKDVGVMAYNIREKNKAQRVAARAVIAKRLVGDQRLSLDIMKQIDAASAKTLDSIPEYLRGVVAMEMGSTSYNNILGYVTRRNIGGALSGARNATQLAISKLRREGVIKEGELKGFPDRGWQKFLEYGPAGSANENMVRTSIVALNAVGGIDADPDGKWPRGGLGEKRGISSWGPKAGTDQQSMLLTNDGQGNIVLIQNTGPDAARKTGLAVERAEAKEIQGQEREVIGLVSKADQVMAEVDRVREIGLSAPTRPLGKIAAVVSGYLGAWGFEETSKKVRDAYSSLYNGITKLSRDDHKISRKPEAGIWLGNKQRSSRAGVTGYLNKLDVDGAKRLIAGAEGDVTTQFRTDEEKAAFIKFAAAPAKVKALLYDMAYTVARASEPGGRLTDRDVANALMQLGYNENGFVSADIFKEVLTQKVNNEVDRHSQLKRQLYLSGLTPAEREKEMKNPRNSYNFAQQYKYIAKRPIPAWLGRAAPAAQPAVAQPAVAQPAAAQRAQTDRLKNTVVNAPITIGGETTSLAQSHPFFAREMIDSSGRLRTQEQVFISMGLPWGTADAGIEGLAEIKNRIAAQEGLAVNNPYVLTKAIQVVRALRDFYKNPDAAAQLQSVLQPPFALSQ